MPSRFRPNTLVLSLVLGLGACSSISGLDAGSKFSCKAPEGVQCDSVSGVYHNALANNLPSQRKAAQTAPGPYAPRTAPAPVSARALRTSTLAQEQLSSSVLPLRAGPRILRVWIKAWEDADRDLVGESMVYVRVDDGQWLLEHVPQRERDGFKPVRAPSKTAAETPDTPAPTTADLARAARSSNAADVAKTLRALQAQQPSQED